MGQAMDFEKLRQRRRRTKMFKRIVVLGAIVIALLGILSINSLLADVGLLTTITDFFQGFGGSGYPIAVPGGVLRDTKDVSGDIAVLNDTSLYVYSTKGKEVLSQQQLNDNTVMAVGGGRILVYDIGATSYTINSRSKVLLESATEYGMLTATVNDRGDYALVTSSMQFVAQVMVYDSNFDLQFEWYSSSQQVVDVSLSPRGVYMAAGCVGAEGGILRSYVNLFELTADTELARVEFTDELLLSVDYQQNNTIAVLTDAGCRLLGEDGRELARYDFDGRAPRFYQHGSSGTLVVLEGDNRTYSAVMLADDMRVLGEELLDFRVHGVAVGREVYLLHDEGIEVYSDAMQHQESFAQRGIMRLLHAGGKLYYFTNEEIVVYGTN